MENIINKIQNNKLLKVEIIVIVICLILGTLLHFTYNWSGDNLFVASFSAINESVWEHLKLSFYPMLIMAIIEYTFVKNIANNYIEAKAVGIFFAISFTIVSFYTYTGIIGVNFFLVDILIFILSIAFGEYVSYKLMKRKNESTTTSKVLAIIILLFLLICFVICTYYPPEVNLFRDFITGTYGVYKN